ncbi:expressed unknown protein [Seminavis robusta]|uniref:Uncharacterized protein n=1 Tax=Seminavis robusta TaxID=568900 RepID=A0A9N8EXC5_9STRA|nr:expressed unknown protein [Seminavis robusta]|eukprot:Sro2044_g312381.1  (120) ;mRNA; f:10774-11133
MTSALNSFFSELMINHQVDAFVSVETDNAAGLVVPPSKALKKRNAKRCRWESCPHSNGKPRNTRRGKDSSPTPPPRRRSSLSNQSLDECCHLEGGIMRHVLNSGERCQPIIRTNSRKNQ